MTYQQTINYLYQRLPMFTKVGSTALKKGLNNIITFCDRLDNPQDKFKTIHIGGTNGKGSTSHMLAAILQTAGYRVGLYTSPHLKDFRERIRINGVMVPEAFITNFVKEQQPLIEQIDPSFFEVTVAMAFSYFEQEKVDVAVIEVGLGGRLDSTNIITPQLSVITNISLDHINILGDTYEAIAAEKAGIIKPGVPVVIGEYDDRTAHIFKTTALSTKSSLVFASDRWQLTKVGGDASSLQLAVKGVYQRTIETDLPGLYQQKNIATVLEAVVQLQKIGYHITENDIVTALRNVKQLTGLLGRWQKLSDTPLTICDTGHNEAGIAEVIKNIAQTPHNQLHFVLGMVRDKDITKVLHLLPKNAIYYFCSPDLERALGAEELAQQASTAGLKGKQYASVKAAFAAAQAAANDNDLVFAGGSTFVVAEIL